MCSAVIVAAGVGKEWGSDRPKQFLSLNGRNNYRTLQPPYSAAVTLNREIILSIV